MTSILLRALWRGIGPALVLVINPVLQYTVFEQLKNALIAKRTNTLRAAGAAATAVAVLSDWDFFLLGALSKLGNCYNLLCLFFTDSGFHQWPLVQHTLICDYFPVKQGPILTIIP